MVLHLNAKLKRLPADLRRSPKAIRSPCNDIHSIICLLSLCHTYSIYSGIQPVNAEKFSIVDENKQYENIICKPEHCYRVACSEVQVCTTKAKEMARNSLEMQLLCRAFYCASLRKHWAGAAWEGHRFRCFITIVYIKSLGRMIKHKKHLTKKKHQVMHEKWDYGIRTKGTANMLTRKSLQS